MRYTIGHEVGHGVRMCHSWDSCAPDQTHSLMFIVDGVPFQAPDPGTSFATYSDGNKDRYAFIRDSIEELPMTQSCMSSLCLMTLSLIPTMPALAAEPRAYWSVDLIGTGCSRRLVGLWRCCVDRLERVGCCG
jgi:hypothetical protein